MKRTISAVLFGLSTMAMAQVTFAVKANLLAPASSASWKELKNTAQQLYQDKGKSSAGFNVGLSAKVDVPATSFYVMPELYYTNFQNKVTDEYTGTSLKAKSNRIDLPVLVGYKVWGNLASLFVGPVASYNLTKDTTFGSFKETATKDFTVGYQLGAQVEVSKLIINARYEGAFSKDQRKFINTLNTSNYEVKYDNRPSFFLLGLGYKF